MAEVSIDIAKETSVEAVKGDTAAIKTDVTAVKGDVSTVKTNVLTVKTNVISIQSKTDLIGATGDTGGSTTSGTVMGKLNKIIGGSGGLMKATATAKKTVTTGLVSGLSMEAGPTPGSVSTGSTYAASANIMTGIYIPKAGKITIKAYYTADSVTVSGEKTVSSYGVQLGMAKDDSLTSYDVAVGTVGKKTITFVTNGYGKISNGSTAGTVVFTTRLSAGGFFNLYLMCERYKSEDTAACSVSGFALTKVEFCYGDNEDIVNL